MIFFLNKLNKFRQALLMSVISLSILSCGGGGSNDTAGISGTGIVQGSITGFGSIFVNGVEYEIDDASFDIDGISGTSIVNNGDLKLGMVVRLDASDNGDGTGVASKIVYEDAVEGPIASIPVVPVSGDTNLKQFDVLSLTVVINATTTTFEGEDSNFGFDTVAMDDVVEVSGFADQAGNIFATRIEKTGVLDTGGSNNTLVEIHGQITDTDPSFIKVDGIKVTTTNSTALIDYTSGVVGLFVEVEGRYQADGSIVADLIEGEDDDRDEITNFDGELSLQGVITDFVDNSDFMVNGIRVDASSITTTVVLENGLQVEVEGELSAGVLIADELEFRSGETEFTALITSVDNILSDRISIGFPNVSGSITLNFDSQSQLEDETGEFDLLTLQDLSVDMAVKVEVKSDGDDWLVTSLKWVDDTEELELEGMVSDKSLVNTTLSLTINGLLVTMDALAEYEIDDEDDVSASDFFAAIEEGSTKVELSDKDQDGDFDSAEIE